MMTIAMENELIAKGYNVKVGFKWHKDEAEKCAKELRADGYYARVAEYSTRVRGLHNFAVWYKKKGE